MVEVGRESNTGELFYFGLVGKKRKGWNEKEIKVINSQTNMFFVSS